MKKPTLATLKAFIRKNEGRLFINQKSSFDGMVDCVMPTGTGAFIPAKPSGGDPDRYTLGIAGVWCVFGSRDYFSPYEDSSYIGLEVYNSCGEFIVAIQKGA
jgi:hypothetical protein